MKFATRVGLKVVDFWYLLNRPSLKRDLLYFDTLAIDPRHLDHCTRFAELLCVLHGKDPAPILGPFQQDLEFLTRAGLMEELRYEDLPLPLHLADHATLKAAEDSARRAFERQADTLLSPKQRMGASATWIAESTRAAMLKARGAPLARSDKRFIPFVSGDLQRVLGRTRGEGSPVLNVVLHQMPVPAEDVEWQRLLDFRNDPDTRASLVLLRDWVGEVAAKPMTEAQLEDSLERRITEYRRHMERSQVKHTRGKWEAIVVPVAEVLENALKFRFSAAAKALFGIAKADLSLLEAEASAPGREVAYVERAEAEFGVH